MKRDNMLNHLAHTLPHWPTEYTDMIEPGYDWAWYDEGPDCTLVLCKGEEEIREADYLQRREELISKPPWEDAPEWAQWLAQDADGAWHWYQDKPEAERGEYTFAGDGNYALAADGSALPDGHNWRDTLEPRPQAQSDIKSWWTSKTCIECGHTTAAEVSDDNPVCPECVTLGLDISDAGLDVSGGGPDVSDPVNHPAHYQSDNGIECIDAIRAALGRDGFIAYCRGNSIKYAWRSDRKGKAAEDKRKAAWYLDRAAKELES